jgi:hypothetical protein
MFFPSTAALVLTTLVVTCWRLAAPASSSMQTSGAKVHQVCVHPNIAANETTTTFFHEAQFGQIRLHFKTR